MKNPMFSQIATYKVIDSVTAKILAPKPKSRMTVNDLLVLAAAGAAVLRTNRAVKGEPRRLLRSAVKRAFHHVESL